MKALRLLLLIILACTIQRSQGQETINVGSILKYTGGPTKLSELKDTNLYLRTLESQIASAAIRLNGVRYIDRTSVDQIFQELNLSNDAAFDASSGALRGLLGRLDLLIVIDSADSSFARLRAIDLQDGSVRNMGTCKRGFLSSPSDGSADCAKNFVGELAPITKELAQAKRRRQADNARRAAEVAVQRAAEARQAAQERKAAQAKAAAEEKAARLQADADEKDLAERQAAISALQPGLEELLSRLQSADEFWKRMQQSLSEQGKSLRTEVQTLLHTADKNGSRCQQLATALDSVGLRGCMSELTMHLDKLDSFK
jgi:hypothetical protein